MNADELLGYVSAVVAAHIDKEHQHRQPELRVELDYRTVGEWRCKISTEIFIPRQGIFRFAYNGYSQDADVAFDEARTRLEKSLRADILEQNAAGWWFRDPQR